jgi:hypothetical protein
VLRGREGLRDAEVGHDGVAFLQQDVGGLDVPVDDAVPVRRLQGSSDLTGDLNRLVDGQLLVTVEPLTKRLALHVGHHEVEQTVGVARIVDRQDVGVGEASRDLDLAQEAVGPDSCRQIGVQDLEGDLAMVFEVLGQIDPGHPAHADLPLDRVAVGQCRLEARR